MRQGIIAAVCVSPKSGIPKYPQEKVVIGQYGFTGDFHCQPEIPGFGKEKGRMMPNRRHITLVAEEFLQEASRELALGLEPGAFSENITTRGLGNLSGIAVSTQIRLNGTVILRVLQQNKPCKVLSTAYGASGPALVKFSVGKRGLICVVEEGIGFELIPGGKIEVLD